MIKYKGKTIHPYESFYWNTTQKFFRGQLGGGIARCVKCDDSLATLVMKQTEDMTVQQVGNIVENKENGFSNPQRGRVYSPNGLAPCLNTVTGGGLEPKVIEPTIMAMRGRNPDHPSERGKSNRKYKQRLEMNNNGTSNTLTGVQKDNLVVEPKIINAGYVNNGKHQQDFVQNEDGICRTICTGTHASTPHLLKTLVSEPQIINPLKGKTDNGWHYEQQVYADEGITRAIKAGGGSGNIPKVVSELEPVYRIRKLTPKECFRLMGVDDADIDTIQASGISNSSQYKLAGNSIVVDVLYHIFRKAFVEKDNKSQQLTFF